MNRRAVLRDVGISLGTGALAGCFGVGAEPEGAYDVGMSTRDFRPEVIEVAAAETVLWRNTSSHAHTVTAYEEKIPAAAAYWASGGFDSESAARAAWRNGSGGALYQGDEYERTFAVPGQHHYVCVPHEASGMVGTVVVTE